MNEWAGLVMRNAFFERRLSWQSLRNLPTEWLRAWFDCEAMAAAREFRRPGRTGARQIFAHRPRERLVKNFGNTTHGSGWIVQVQPTKGGARPFCFVHFLPRATRGGRRGKTGIPGAPLV